MLTILSTLGKQASIFTNFTVFTSCAWSGITHWFCYLSLTSPSACWSRDRAVLWHGRAYSAHQRGEKGLSQRLGPV